MKNLLKPEQVAELLATSRSKVYQLAKDRKIRYERLGDGTKSSIRFQEQDVEEYVNSCRIEPLNGYNSLDNQTRQRPRKRRKKRNGALST